MRRGLKVPAATVLTLILAIAGLLLFAGCEKTPVAGDMTSAETTAEPAINVSTKKKITSAQFGLEVFSYTISDSLVADVEVLGGGIIVYAKTTGKIKVNVSDCFGHTASADLTITVTIPDTPDADSSGAVSDATTTHGNSGDPAQGNISAEIHKTTDRFIEVKTGYGARGNGLTDDTAAIQKAIDAANPGETVYIYPGIYKVTLLVMREGVTLEMYTTMGDAKEGFTSQLARQTAKGEITVLSGVRFMNNGDKKPGRDGSGNFTIRGGVLDMLNTTRGAVIFGCADGVTLENIIFKDINNNHAIQLTGCKDTTVKNCMFAGYTWGGTFTREVLQVEVSTPGATGAVPNSPLSFEEGEYNYCENIEITGCYFGKSDKAGAPIMAIGHHSYAGDATVTGFKITDNTFDEVLYAAIRYCNTVDTEISGNTFISTSEYMNVSDPSATTPAFIVIYSATSATTYKNIVDGRTVTKTLATGQAGTHDMKITGNRFTLGAGSDKRIIYVTGTQNIKGLAYAPNLLLQERYDSAPYSYSGYTVCRNVISGMTFADNTIKIEGQPKYTNYFMSFTSVYNLSVWNNTYDIAPGVGFTSASDGVSGLYTRSITNGEQALRRLIAAAPTAKYVSLENPDGEILLKTAGTFNIVLDVRGGGRIETSADADGNGIVKVIPGEGYVFDGWYDQSGLKITERTLTFKSLTTLVAVFKTK